MEKKEFSDVQLLEKLYQYLDTHDITQDSASKTLGVSRETLSKWKSNNGEHELSIKNRKGIKALIFNTDELNYETDPLNKMLLEEWRELTKEKKYKVLAYIEQLKTLVGVGEGQSGELRQTNNDNRMGFKAKLLNFNMAIAR